jgi:hypothetical protein
MIKTLTAFLVLLTTSFGILHSQERVQGGKTYQGGDVIFAPVSGIEFAIPEHWSGYYIPESEMFYMRSDTSSLVNVLLAVNRDETLEAMRFRWNKGVELVPDIFMNPATSFDILGDELSGELYMSNNKNVKGFALSKCGDFNACAVFLLTAPTAEYLKFDKTLEGLAAGISMKEPSLESLEDEFDWKSELEGKYLLMNESTGTSTRGNHLWLCYDGTFTMDLKRKGLAKKQAGKYKGKSNGRFTIIGTGATGQLILQFEGKKDLEKLTVELTLKGEAIYLNEDRYFRSENTKCN